MPVKVRPYSLGNYPVHTYIFLPNAGDGVVVAGDGQDYHISGPADEIAFKLYVTIKTAPLASGLPVTIQYGDTDDLDTVTWGTTIATITGTTNDNTVSTTTMTTQRIPAFSIMRLNIGTIVGSPDGVKVHLMVLR